MRMSKVSSNARLCEAVLVRDWQYSCTAEDLWHSTSITRSYHLFPSTSEEMNRPILREIEI